MNFEELLPLCFPMSFSEIPVGRFFLYKAHHRNTIYVLKKKQDSEKTGYAIAFSDDAISSSIVFPFIIKNECYLVCTNDLCLYCNKYNINYIPVEQKPIPSCSTYIFINSFHKKIEQEKLKVEKMEKFFSLGASILEDRSVKDIEMVKKEWSYVKSYIKMFEQQLKNGRWLDSTTETWTPSMKCSVCGQIISAVANTIIQTHYNYCPNCGAKMDLGFK